MHPAIHSIETLADTMGVHAITVRRWIAARTVPASRVGRAWRMWGPAVVERLFGDAVQAGAHVADPGPEPPEIVDIVTVAELLGISESTARTLVRSGALPAARVGRTYRLHWPTIRDRIARGEDLTPPGAPAHDPSDDLHDHALANEEDDEPQPRGDHKDAHD